MKKKTALRRKSDGYLRLGLAITGILTALILVGDVIDHSSYERSKLYDPAFTTKFRKGVPAEGGNQNEDCNH